MSGQLKEVRERITSVTNTQQITKAMKMVSAAKLRRAQQAIVEVRPYANRLNTILRNILASLDGQSGTAFGADREVNSALVVVITSNRGLAGAFNTNIIKAAVATIEELSGVRKAGGLSILCIGKKGFDYFRKRYTDCNIISDHVTMVNNLSFESSAEVSQFVMDSFEKGLYDRAYVAYSNFKNAGVQFAISEQFLPVKPIEVTQSRSRADYLFEPSEEQLLVELVPTILHTTFFKYLLDTHASEHGARMTAMDKASENANEIIKDLKITYNKARQEAITKELSEIVGGAAALSS